MLRQSLSLIAVAATLSMLPGPALALQSTTVGNWTVGYDKSADICYMQINFVEGSNKSSFRIEIDYDGGALIQISNDEWTMPSSETSVEIWYGRNVDRAADAVKEGRWHNESGKTHLDVAFDRRAIDGIRQQNWMVLRTSTNGHFKNYNLTQTTEAVSKLWECDAEWDW